MTDLLLYVFSAEMSSTCFRIDQLSALPEQKRHDVRDLVLIDAEADNMASFELELLSAKEDVASTHHLCMFNLDRDSGVEARFLRQGIRGFFYRTDSLSLMSRGITAISEGEIWVSREILLNCAINPAAPNGAQNAGGTSEVPLTRREVQILMMVCVGSSNDEIAESLFISAHTVKTHLYNIFKKIEVPNRLQAALWASKNL